MMCIRDRKIIRVVWVIYWWWVFVINIDIIKVVGFNKFNGVFCKSINFCLVYWIISIGCYCVEIIVIYVSIVFIKIIVSFSLIIYRD